MRSHHSLLWLSISPPIPPSIYLLITLSIRRPHLCVISGFLWTWHPLVMLFFVTVLNSPGFHSCTCLFFFFSLFSFWLHSQHIAVQSNHDDDWTELIFWAMRGFVSVHQQVSSSSVPWRLNTRFTVNYLPISASYLSKGTISPSLILIFVLTEPWQSVLMNSQMSLKSGSVSVDVREMKGVPQRRCLHRHSKQGVTGECVRSLPPSAARWRGNLDPLKASNKYHLAEYLSYTHPGKSRCFTAEPFMYSNTLSPSGCR